MTVLVFLLVLTFLVLIHEFGHFVTARLFGVKVEEFGIGLPPRVKTLFTWRGVPFTLNALPLGGFVRMEGEEGTEATEKKHQKGTNTYLAPFYTKPAWQRLIIILTGATVNFLFGIVAFIIIFSILGVPERILDTITIEAISENSPAQTAGLQPGDVIDRVQPLTGNRAFTGVDNDDFRRWTSQYAGQEVKVTYIRNGQTQTTTLRIRTEEERPRDQGAMGVQLMTQYEIRDYPWYITPYRATVVGIQQSIEFGKDILFSLGTIVTDLAGGKVSADVAGPVGIVYQAGKEQVFQQGVLSTLNFAALLSINLAIMNVLPIPALDGGRAVFILVERLFSKKTRFAIEHMLNTAGFVFLLSLIFLITLKDVAMIVREML